MAIRSRLAREEDAFLETVEAGMERLARLSKAGVRSVPGEEAFLLHDTYGFPIELTEEVARDLGMQIDREGFDLAMTEQRRRARVARAEVRMGTEAYEGEWSLAIAGSVAKSINYRKLSVEHVFLRRLRQRDDLLEIVLSRTCAYPEGGGQVADRGHIENGQVRASIEHVYRQSGEIVHRIRLLSGTRQALREAGEQGQLRVVIDPQHRIPTERHHTATHLLHATLRAILGSHVHQKGSLVAPDHLRFDFSHFESLSAAQLASIEITINSWIQADRSVSYRTLSFAAAVESGAMALFGEKYGTKVRVVSVEGVPQEGIEASRELCGGTHVRRTGEIGAFVITSESAVGSGIRRIEAKCGIGAITWVQEQRALLIEAASTLQTSPSSLPEQIKKLHSDLGELQKRLRQTESENVLRDIETLSDWKELSGGVRFFTRVFPAKVDQKLGREIGDLFRRLHAERSIAFLAFTEPNSVTATAVSSDDVFSNYKIRMDELIRHVAPEIGGGGGGKPTLAVAGGKNPAGAKRAIEEAESLIQGWIQAAESDKRQEP
jgi:alanyl-tRNA synthetase